MKDHGNWDFDHRKEFHIHHKIRPYGDLLRDNWNSTWCAQERHQRDSTIERRRNKKHCNSHTRHRLQNLLRKEYNDI